MKALKRAWIGGQESLGELRRAKENIRELRERSFGWGCFGAISCRGLISLRSSQEPLLCLFCFALCKRKPAHHITLFSLKYSVTIPANDLDLFVWNWRREKVQSIIKTWQVIVFCVGGQVFSVRTCKDRKFWTAKNIIFVSGNWCLVKYVCFLRVSRIAGICARKLCSQSWCKVRPS